MRLFTLFVFLGLFTVTARAQSAAPPSPLDPRISDIVSSVSAERIESDIRILAGFGTRHTLSDTTSQTRGIGAARRWLYDAFRKISTDCAGCLDVYYQRSVVAGESRIPDSTVVVNVVAVQRGTVHPNRYVIMTGDIDSRASDVMDATIDAPGANDNASGLAGTLEAARLLTQYEFGSTIIYAGLSGEEQGLFGGEYMAEVAKGDGWDVAAVFNNDMIGNIEGLDGVIDNTVFRVFSQPFSSTATERELRRMRYFGGEVDGPSRQLARYVDRITDLYMTNLDAMMIYRLDRFGRGGHHRPFNDLGFPAVRIMEAHEDYTEQHQDVRVEDGIEYGDVIDEVDFEYAAKLTAVNAAVLASLAWAPPAPSGVRIGGAVSPSTTLEWDGVDDPGLAGYKVYWRKTTSPQWEEWRFVPRGRTRHTLENVIIDNFLFGVASVGEDGNESPVVFPGGMIQDESAGARDARIPQVDSLLEAEVAAGHIPGVTIQIKRDGTVLHRAAYGYAHKFDYGLIPLEPPDPMTPEHIFDLASLTKVFGTTFGVMLLVDAGQINLDDPVIEYLPEFSGGDKDAITVRHLLTHSSGLPQWEPTYYHADSPREVFQFICRQPLAYEVGEARHYSDLGFMLLGFMIERISGQTLDAYLKEHVYKPLGLEDTTFEPLEHGFPRERIAATSHGNPFERRMVYDDTFGYKCDEDPESWDGWRTYTIRGEVSDGNAFYANGGVAGHAGLFSTLSDLQVLVDLMLDEGGSLLSPEVVRTFLTKDAYGNGLGWAMDLDVIGANGAPPGTFGHTGFTGTNVVAMPALDLSIILLTNRENVGQNESGYYYDLGHVRQEIVSIVLSQVTE